MKNQKIEKMINVLIVLNSAELGGTERYVSYIVKYIDRSKFNISLLFLQDGPFIEVMKTYPIKTYLINRKSPFKISAIFTIFVFLLKNNFDIIHTNSSTLTRLIGFFLFIKRIETRHGIGYMLDAQKKPSRILLLKEKIKCLFANKIITVSMFDKSILLGILKYNKQKISVIYNGIEEIEAVQSDNEIKQYHFPPSTKVLGLLGRLSPEKGIPYVIKAMEYLQSRDKNIVLLIIGDGPSMNQLKKEVEMNKLNHCIYFTGSIKNPFPLARRFDLYLLPSLREGIPYSLLEMMSLGIVPVANNITGIPEVIRDGYNGFLTNTTDSKNLSDLIIDIIYDDERLSDMSYNAKITIKERFFIENSIHNLQKEYIDLLQK